MVATLSLTACGGGDRTALAIEELRWIGTTTLVVTTECATEVEAEVGPDHSDAGLPEVTLWGNPSLGTCQPSVAVVVPEGTTRVVDGTTSMVVDLPARS